MADPGVIHLINLIGRRKHATPMELKSAYETGLVESNLENLPGGSGDSAGWRQERRSLYPDPTNLDASIGRYFDEARALRGKFGTAGALAAAVQRPKAQYRGRYQERSADADALLRSLGQGSSGGGGVGPGVQGSLTVSPGAAPGFDAGNGASDPSVLAGLLQQPQAAPPLQVQAPNSALKYLTGSGNVPVAQAAAPRVDVGALAGLLQPAEGLPEAQGRAPKVSVNVSGSPTAHAASVSSGRSPVTAAGKIIGTPYTGTHTLGDWQSDRAYDIAVPKGTPMVALQNGTVVKVTRHPQGSGRFAGDQITIRGANGNEYFYAHGVASVKAGQRVRKGEQLGVTGSANGVEHLHFAQMRGDPSMHLPVKR